jgi:hypothetical protein
MELQWISIRKIVPVLGFSWEIVDMLLIVADREK